MPESLGDRIILAAQTQGRFWDPIRGLNQTALQQAADISSGLLSRVLKGTRGLGLDGAKKVARALEVNLEWLTDGKGPMKASAADAQAELAVAVRKVESDWPARISEERRDQIIREVSATVQAETATAARPQTVDDWVSLLRARIAREKGKAVKRPAQRDE